MAYCKKCGAYIPDGESKCFACGYDEAAERAAEEKRKKESRGGFAAQEYDAERREAERKKREQERQRREYERQRREDERRREYEEKRKEQQERDRQWAEREYERRARASQQQNEYNPTAGMYKKPMKHKAMAVMSYISIFCLLPFLFCKDDKYAVYHARQGLTLILFGAIADMISALIPMIGGLLSIFRMYLMIKGIINAANDRMEPLPYIGKYGER